MKTFLLIQRTNIETTNILHQKLLERVYLIQYKCENSSLLSTLVTNLSILTRNYYQKIEIMPVCKGYENGGR